MSVDAGPVQRGVALGVRDVGVRVLGEEMLHYLEVPIGGGEEERSTALDVRRVGGHALAEVALHVFHVSVSRSLNGKNA